MSDKDILEVPGKVFDAIRENTAELEREVARLTAENQALIEAARWVPCSERLPEVDPNDRYGMTSKYVSVHPTDEYEQPIGYWSFHGKAWFREGDVIEVTHWRPLPAPPEGEA